MHNQHIKQLCRILAMLKRREIVFVEKKEDKKKILMQHLWLLDRIALPIVHRAPRQAPLGDLAEEVLAAEAVVQVGNFILIVIHSKLFLV